MNWHYRNSPGNMNFYKDKVNQYETAGAKLDETINRLSTLRLVAFVLSLALIFFLANERMLASLFFVVPLCGIGFGVLINRFNKLSFERQHSRIPITTNSRFAITLSHLQYII